MAVLTARRPSPRSLADVRDPAGDTSYPRKLLEGRETALVLFSAAFHGRQDAWHIADAGLKGTCVDMDGAKLAEMQAVYPDGWEFVEDDAFAFADNSVGYRTWDIVSLDPFSSLFDRCADLIGVWCLLARRAVVLGTGEYTVLDAPAGWRMTDRRKRSDFRGGVYWSVMELE